MSTLLTGCAGRLQQYSVCVRTDRLWQELLNARSGESGMPERDHPSVLRARVRGCVSGGGLQVPGPRIIPGDLQRGDTRPAWL